ncbi:MAG TPA: universal stress protein [Dehalococcoidia bacterium]|jgi:nucleotide-binding universal stress UspA family protein|nr:universal stress protein [Dehalococcoidia bacterium]
MFERILVPLDGSKVGEAALEHVEKLVAKMAPGMQVEVILFQVITSLAHYVIAGEASVQVPYTEEEIEQIKKKAREYLNQAGERLKSKGVKVKTKVATGKAAEEIIKAADEFKADLIAMSTHGRSGLSRLTFGSVTDKVLRTGNVPVLVVRAPKETAET